MVADRHPKVDTSTMADTRRAPQEPNSTAAADSATRVLEAMASMGSART
jgi:hypothetical protein